MAIVFPWFLPLCFNISINIHEFANEMSFILTIDINVFVIYGITDAITSCHNDSFFLPENCLLMDFKAVFNIFIKIHEYEKSILCITYQMIKRLHVYLCFTNMYIYALQ